MVETKIRETGKIHNFLKSGRKAIIDGNTKLDVVLRCKRQSLYCARLNTEKKVMLVTDRGVC